MLKLAFALLLSSLVAASPAMAGAGHEHGPGGSHSHGPISNEAVIQKATKQVQSLVERGKLDKSWVGIKATGATQKEFAKGPEWVVSFQNKQVSEAAKQNLYMFFTLEGSYIATNYTGE